MEAVRDHIILTSGLFPGVVAYLGAARASENRSTTVGTDSGVLQNPFGPLKKAPRLESTCNLSGAQPEHLGFLPQQFQFASVRQCPEGLVSKGHPNSGDH